MRSVRARRDRGGAARARRRRRRVPRSTRSERARSNSLPQRSVRPMPFGTHVVCARCGGAGEHPRQRSSKELKREAGKAKMARRARELEELLSTHPAVSGCLVAPQAPGKLACAYLNLSPSVLDTSVANSDTLMLAGIMEWLDRETRRAGEPARANGALRFFPGGVHFVDQLPSRPSVLPARRPWDQCDTCNGSGLVAAAASKLSTPAEDGPLIAVVGGGIGGAALAVALQQRGMRVVVYERDESFSSRCVRNPSVLGQVADGSSPIAICVGRYKVLDVARTVIRRLANLIGFSFACLQSARIRTDDAARRNSVIQAWTTARGCFILVAFCFQHSGGNSWVLWTCSVVQRILRSSCATIKQLPLLWRSTASCRQLASAKKERAQESSDV